MKADYGRVGVYMQVYRNEPSMHMAVKSVMAQSYRNWKFYIMANEVTKPELAKYAEQDERIVFLEGAAGRGYKHVAKDLARDGNRYMVSLDADDMLMPEFLQRMLDHMVENELDIVACGFKGIDNDNRIRGEKTLSKLIWTREESAIYIPYFYAYFRPIWGKVFTSEVILKFDETRLPDTSVYGGYGGDTIFSINLLYEAEKVGQLDEALYFYRSSPTGGTYRYSEGRLNSDELLFRFVEKFLNEVSEINERAYRFLYLVYASAIDDTIKLLYHVDNFSAEEKRKHILHIFENPLTQELALRCKERRINLQPEVTEDPRNKVWKTVMKSYLTEERTSEADAVYHTMFSLFYPEWNAILSEGDRKVLMSEEANMNLWLEGKLKELFERLVDGYGTQPEAMKEHAKRLLYRLADKSVSKLVFQNDAFLMKYGDIIKCWNRKDTEQTIDLCKQALEIETEADQGVILADIWISLAAKEDRISEFVLGKQIRIELNYISNHIEEAKKEYEELLEYGIADETMDYLDELMKGDR